MRLIACIVIWFVAFLVQAADRPNIIWIVGTGDMGAIPETELIARGLVADKLSEYATRVKPLPENQKP
jgi:hypothetical protein